MKSSPQITLLVSNKKVCRDIAKAYESLMLILSQNQRDIVTEENMDRIGPAILAHKEIVDIIDFFDAAGRLIIRDEEKVETAKTKNQ